MTRRSVSVSSTKSKRRRAMVIKHIDNVTKQEMAKATPRLSRAFVRYASLALLLHLLVVGATVFEFIYVPLWTLYLRFLLLPRIVILFLIVIRATCCLAINVGQMYRPGSIVKYLRTLSSTPMLWLWMVLGYADLALRILSFFLDVSAPLWLQTGQPPVMSYLRAGIDVLVIAEFFATRNIIYEQGVRRNVVLNLLTEKKTRETAPV